MSAVERCCPVDWTPSLCSLVRSICCYLCVSTPVTSSSAGSRDLVVAASMLCGCSKRRRRGRSSTYHPVTVGEELLTPPTTTTRPAPATAAGGTGVGHVERYVAAGGTAVTVSVRPQPPRHHHHQGNESNVVTSQLSNYDDVLDEYLCVAIATHDSGRHVDKVYRQCV